MDTVSGPFPMHVTYTLTDTADGTRVSVRNQGGSGWMFALFSPLIGRMVNSRVKGDLVALKAALEGALVRGLASLGGPGGLASGGLRNKIR